jgi:hypothetical protein
MNELVISASMEISVMLEAVASDIREHFYSAKPRGSSTTVGIIFSGITIFVRHRSMIWR